jgi:integrase
MTVRQSPRRHRPAGRTVAVEEADTTLRIYDVNQPFTPMEPRNLNRHLSNLRAAAGLSTVRLHDMRPTVVSMLMELGVRHVVQAIARHADVNYSHSNLDAMRPAVGKLDGRLP